MIDAVSFFISNIGTCAEDLFTVLVFGMVSESFVVFSCSQYLLNFLYAVSPSFKD